VTLFWRKHNKVTQETSVVTKHMVRCNNCYSVCENINYRNTQLKMLQNERRQQRRNSSYNLWYCSLRL